jgi:hypothetical protein
MPLLPITITTQYSKTAKGLSEAGNRAGNRPYSTQLLLQQITTQPHLSQILRYKEYSIPKDSQTTQFGFELGNSDCFSNNFIPGTQY